MCLFFENYALTIWKSQWKVQVDCIAQEVYTSWAGRPGTACLWLLEQIPNGSRSWPSLPRYSLKALFSYPVLLFLFLILSQVWLGFWFTTTCSYYPYWWQQWLGIMTGNLVLWSDHLVICPVELESSLAQVKDDWTFVYCWF